MYDFASILFSGPCNARCPFCIGQQVHPALTPPNLTTYPPRNLDALVQAVHRHAIREVILTGTNTDPQMYAHEERLLERLRADLPSGTRLSLHTNGRLALRKLSAFNAYNRVTLSFPAFDPHVYRRVMGVPHPPDLRAILERARLPVKISIIAVPEALSVLGDTLIRLADLGIRRVALRKRYGDARPWAQILPSGLALPVVGQYRGNPVCTFQGMEVTLWDFAATQSRVINLFASGHISTRYQIVQAVPQIVSNV
ncbi:MAG: hypothetical protein Fur0018_23080 [Anaerolineales bacterium]